ncbi:MAG: ribonuclease R [Deltaproteobacteria bacterium CG11_big_fil_rev_8_21_14_0_20_47_16]|nr:MAG: ribonuclease R [Deltaproteobacteria bacterium CG11_big_fil_rev_8_21_14_0_20_47_16]
MVSAKADSTLWKGDLTLHRDGYGFVIPDDTNLPDVFIPERFLNGAWHKDKVVVRVSPADSRGRREGRVAEVLGHGLTQIVGHVVREQKKWWLVPNDDRIRLQVRITSDPIQKLKEGDVVVLRLTHYADDREGPAGEVIQHLDERGSLATETAIVIAEHQLQEEFPENVVTEAEREAREEIHGGHGRTDLRRVPLVTIDGETAKDFDDAVAAQVEGQDIRIWVAIADVSHYVRPGTPLDEEAYGRGTSVYFPGFCIPMLPQALSEDVCSLRPDVDRYSMVCEVLLSPKCEIKETKFYRGIIRSHARLTYNQVQEFLTGNTSHMPHLPDNVLDSIRQLERAAKLLRQMRRDRGTVDFDLPEPAIELDIATGDVEQIAKANRFFAHFLIEELMIMANEAVARFLTNSKAGCVYRIHDKPSEERIEMLIDLMHSLGYKPKVPRPMQPTHISGLTKLVHGKPEERFVNHMLLRAMAQAVYDPGNIGHFGLASKCYCHFTSPIRRYPDLIIHRLLGNVIDRKKGEKPQPVLHKGIDLAVAAKHCSRRERVAMEAEREMVSLYIASFMQQHVGEVFTGIISHCSKYGFYVELNEYFVEGTVPLQKMAGDRFTFDPSRHAIVGRKTKKEYHIGEVVKVRVVAVDMLRRQTEFELV